MGGVGYGMVVVGIVIQVVLMVQIMFVCVLGIDGLGDISVVVQVIVWVVDYGVNIINLSLGSNEVLEVL